MRGSPKECIWEFKASVSLSVLTSVIGNYFSSLSNLCLGVLTVCVERLSHYLRIIIYTHFVGVRNSSPEL